uniref:Uncharacterized protein n=1 Tax=Ascaris lumbricoides TaxID=6252 RepID=A0A0M3HT11_ASCLU
MQSCAECPYTDSSLLTCISALPLVEKSSTKFRVLAGEHNSCTKKIGDPSGNLQDLAIPQDADFRASQRWFIRKFNPGLANNEGVTATVDRLANSCDDVLKTPLDLFRLPVWSATPTAVLRFSAWRIGWDVLRLNCTTDFPP